MKLAGGTKIAGITTGRNSYIAVFKSGLTKLKNGSIGNTSARTLFKGVVSISALKSIGTVSSGVFSGLIDWFEYLFMNKKDGIGYV